VCEAKLELFVLIYSFGSLLYRSMPFTKEVVTEAPGGAPGPRRGDNVSVHCTGFGKNGDLSKKFWSTKDTNEPFSFQIGMGSVIKGWDEGVMTMVNRYLSSCDYVLLMRVLDFQKKGEVARITCTPDYAYGAGGFPAWGIMPNSTLIFEIEVLSIN
jgi:peptidylprolyl isomerase